jgi:transcriptional regulator with XRE-family HTH domain
MSNQRTVSSTLSADVIQYLRAQGHTQAHIARMLGLTEGFISLVKSRDRSLTLDHLELLTESLGVPLGAFLLAVTAGHTKTLDTQRKKLVELAAEIMQKADAAGESIMRKRTVSSR